MDTTTTAGDQAAAAARRVGAGALPAVVTICALGVLLTGLCLAAADRLDRSAPARVLAVVAVAAALVAMATSVLGHLLTVLPDRGAPASRRGVPIIMLAGTLGVLAVGLAGSAALVVVLRDDPVGAAAEPAVTVQLSGGPQAMTVSAKLTFSGLPVGSLLDAKMSGIDAAAGRQVIARALVTAGADGMAVADLGARVDGLQTVLIEARSPNHTCTVGLPVGLPDSGSAPTVHCARP